MPAATTGAENVTLPLHPGDRVAFGSGATEALNLALRALLGPRDTVLTTAFEHSSVVRPLRALRHDEG